MRAAVGGWVSRLDLAWLAGGRLLGAGLGFLGVSLVARTLSPGDLGLWSMALALQGYLLHLSEMGLRSVATAEAGLGPGRWRGLLGRYLLLRLSASAALIAAAFSLLAFVRSEALPAFALVLFSLPLVALQLDWVPLAEGRAGRAGGLLLVRPFAFLVLLHALPPPLGLVQVAAAWTGAWAIAAAATWPGLPAGTANAHPPPPVRTFLRRGLPLMGVTLSNQAQASLDLLLAGLLLAPEAAGRLYLVLAVLAAALIPANALGQLTLARLGRHRGDSVALAAALEGDARQLAWVMLPLGGGLALVAPVLAPLVFGEAHAAAAPLFPLFAPWLFLQAQTTLLQGALAALGRGDGLLRVNLVALAAASPVVALALWSGRIEALVLARTLAEALRLWRLARLLGAPAWRAWLRGVAWPGGCLAVAAAGSVAYASRPLARGLFLSFFIC
ncbi:MAG: oligosaccharide flippase family protein, partial [Geminicoccaceae bacterium]|nr:oligosaccharide flippase family protein [Geminicoccaceae bacterium]